MEFQNLKLALKASKQGRSVVLRDAPSWRRRITANLAYLATLLALGPLGTWSACSDDDACQGGKNCTFSGSGTYTHTCGDSSGCNYTCEDGATCNLSCPSGGCNVTATNAAAVTLDCPGGTCSLHCEGTDTCVITGCSSLCQVNCGGATNCQNSCDEMSGCATTE